MVTARVLPLRNDASSVEDAAADARAALERHLDRCALATRTVTAYRRQADAYVSWLGEHAGDHADAFVDVVGAEGAVTAWKRHLLHRRLAASTVNQALAAVTLLYELAGLRIAVKRVRVPAAGEPDALTTKQQAAVERAADRRGPRDAAIVSLLLYAGPRVEECERLDVEDLAITARTGKVRLLGKGDQPRTVPLPAKARARITAWLAVRGREPGPLWTSQRAARLTASGITQVALEVGIAAGVPGLRPHRFRHTYATRLREDGADPAQVQYLLGHASLASTAPYFRAGFTETAGLVERVFTE